MTKQHKLYLERLRRSGAINMYGAATYIEHDFNVSKQEARSILSEWMRTYDRNDPDYEELGGER